MLTLSSHFTGSINLANTASSTTMGQLLAEAISTKEKQFLTEILGYAMATEVYTNEAATSGVWYDFINGADFTDSYGRSNHWDGFKTLSRNPIANYIYFMLMKENNPLTVGIGNMVANGENMKPVSGYDKGRTAWNDMVDMLTTMHDFLYINKSSYPNYIGLTYSPYCDLEYFRKIGF